MKNFKNKNTLQIVLLVVIAVVTLGIGYAAISAVNLIINGNATASINQENFKVYFVNTGDTPSLTGNVSVTGAASISTQDNTVALFDVGGLTKVGDYAIATYTIINNSNAIGADITLNVTNSNSNYFKVTESIADSQLQAGDTTTGTIKVEMIKTPVDNTVTTSVKGTLTATPIENELATGNYENTTDLTKKAFYNDSWSTIKDNIQNNNTKMYNVGDEKIVRINNVNYRVRIANKNYGEYCDDSSYSETACGFVVEFVDIIKRSAMSRDIGNDVVYPTYSGTMVYSYLQDTLYGQLPSDLKEAISTTRVISGYRCKSDVWDSEQSKYVCQDLEGENSITYDKLYLLSNVEVFGSDSTDTASTTSVQLDYYRNNKVTFSTNNNYAIKNESNGSKWAWWLRDIPYSFNNQNCMMYYYVDKSYFKPRYYYYNRVWGVAPAFRIG